MKRELNVYMSFYLLMNDNETKEDAESRFNKIMSALSDSSELHESSIQIYETSVQEI